MTRLARKRRAQKIQIIAIASFIAICGVSFVLACAAAFVLETVNY
jgi:hypothetical protein